MLEYLHAAAVVLVWLIVGLVVTVPFEDWIDDK
jgi:hypothetical protein